MSDGVNTHGEPCNMNKAEEKCDRVPRPELSGQPGQMTLLGNTALALAAVYCYVVACGVIRVRLTRLPSLHASQSWSGLCCGKMGSLPRLPSFQDA